MDYKRIYEELIEHRKMMPKLEGVYYERHHIVPVCMGGGDEDENLVWLTAKEHFIAHLLLALIYGGALWFAAQAMTMTKEGRKLNSRMFSRIREEWSKEMRKRRTSKLVHDVVVVSTRETFRGTQSEIRVKYGLSVKDSSNLVRRKAKIVKGVALSETDLSKSWHPDVSRKTGYRSYDDNRYEFRCIKTKEVFLFTRCEFAAHSGVTPSRISALLKGVMLTTKGYCLNSTTDADLKYKGRSTSRKYLFRVISTGVVYERTTHQMITEFGLSRSAVEGLICGKSKTLKGFCLDSTIDASDLHRMPKGSIVTLRKISDGTLVKGTSNEIANTCGFDKTMVSKLFRQEIRQCKGYEFISYETPPTEVQEAPT